FIAQWIARRADDWGRKPMLVAGFSVLPLRVVLFALAPDPWYLVGVQALGGLTTATIGIMTPLVIADLTRGTGRFNLAQGAAGTASALGGAQHRGHRLYRTACWLYIWILQGRRDWRGRSCLPLLVSAGD